MLTSSRILDFQAALRAFIRMQDSRDRDAEDTRHRWGACKGRRFEHQKALS